MWRRVSHGRVLLLHFPASAVNAPRYGHGNPSHPRLKALLDEHADAAEAALATIVSCAEPLSRIAHSGPPDGLEPRWVNPSIPALDCAALYAFAATRPLRRCVEIGSGESTRFIARARRDRGRDFLITSIDPQPRTEINALCDEPQRVPLELADLSVFDELAAGDMVFCDGSHHLHPSSDVAVFWMDVVPRLADGVLVGIHDVLLPDDYSQWMIDFSFNEQYVLAAALLAGATRLRPVLASWYVGRSPEGRAALDPLWSRLGEVERFGSAFWFQTAGT